MDNNTMEVVKEIIENIDREIATSSSNYTYKTKEGVKINTDMEFLTNWWDEYRTVLRRRYGIE